MLTLNFWKLRQGRANENSYQMVWLGLIPLIFSGACLAEGAAKEAAVLEEIIITATKRSESLQDVPISISAINSVGIERSGAAKLSDLDRSVPNLVFTGPDGGTQIGIRGVSDGSRNMGSEMRVGVYVDGIYRGRAQSINQDLMDIERVEILRGPQGTLFGKDTIAGAINIITAKPDEDLHGKFALGFGNYNKQTRKGSINIPLIDGRLYSKFSVISKKRDGYIKNIFPGQPDYWEENSMTGRAQFRLLMGAATEANLAIEYGDENYAGNSGESNGHVRPDSAPGVHSGNLSQVQSNDLESQRTSLTVNHQFNNGFELVSLTSYREAESDRRWEDDRAEFNMVDQVFFDKETQASQEIRISSPTDTDFNYVAGLYYFYQKSSTLRTALVEDDIVLLGFPAGLIGLRIEQTGHVETNSYAAFIHGNYRMNDQLSASFGLRYTHEEKDILYNQIGAPIFNDIDGFEDDLSEKVWTPSIGLSYTMDNDNLLYATVSRGFKGGGWNADFVNSTEIGFDSEFATSFEIGAKTEWFDNRLRVNVALFHTDFEDFQVFSVRPLITGGALFTLTNAGEVTAKGAELELIAEPFEGLRVSAGIGYTDASYDKFQNGGGAGIHYDGNTLPYAPKVTASLGVGYDFELTNGIDAYFRTGYSYRDAIYTNASNAKPAFYADSFNTLDARFGVSFLEGNFDVALWGKNLTDTEYELEKWVTFTGNSVSKYGEPRTYGIDLSYNF